MEITITTGVLILLVEYVSPKVMLPPGRLSSLLDQVVIAQQEKCFYHHSEGVYHATLLDDHYCKRSKVPTYRIIAQPPHDDEVWTIEFSNSGKYLASGAKDGTLSVYYTKSPLVSIYAVDFYATIYIFTKDKRWELYINVQVYLEWEDYRILDGVVMIKRYCVAQQIRCFYGH